MSQKMARGGEEIKLCQAIDFFEKNGKNNCRQTGEIIVANHWAEICSNSSTVDLALGVIFPLVSFTLSRPNRLNSSLSVRPFDRFVSLSEVWTPLVGH